MPAPQDISEREARREKRIALMVAGIDELERWLEDLCLKGLASVEDESADFWVRAASRMSDAKLSGIAYKIKEMQVMPRDNRMENRMHAIGELFLLCRAFRNRETLSPDEVDELLSVLGVTIQKKEVLEIQTPIRDIWMVLGERNGVDLNRIQYRRVWFKGRNTGRLIVKYDFLFGFTGFEDQWTPGTAWDMTVAIYPGTSAQRMTIGENYGASNQAFDMMPSFADASGFLNDYADAIARSPFLLFYPVCLTGIVLPPDKNGEVYLLCEDQTRLLLTSEDDDFWAMISLSAGEPIEVFGEWNGQTLTPISAWKDGHFAYQVK